MTSSEPLRSRSRSRSRAYHEDLKRRMIYQRKMLSLTYQQIAVNLCVDTSTVWRAVKQFDDKGTVAAKKNKGYHKLIMRSLLFLEALVERPSMYLKVCRHVLDVTGTESAVCRFLQRNNFSHKKITNLAKQHNELLSASWLSVKCMILI